MTNRRLTLGIILVRVPPELIPGTNVPATYLSGRAVFQKPVP